MSPRTRVALGGGVAAVLLLWWTTGSLLVAIAILVLLALAAGLAVVVAAWARPRPEPLTAPLSDGPATTDLSLAPSPGAPVRRALRTLLARPWVHGDALLRATAARLDGEDALVWTPRGQQVAAPHLWVEWNPVDGAEIAGRRPLEALARELAEGYVEHGRERGVRRLAERTWLHLLVSDDVPLGRVVVTAAFSEPQQLPVAAACTATAVPLPPARGASVPAVAPGPGGSDGTSRAPDVRGVPRRPSAARPAGGSDGTSRAPDVRGVPSLPPGTPAGPGARIAALATTAVPARLRTLVAGPAARALLVVEDAAGARLADTEITGRTELGRDPAAGVVVDHPGVSWRHLRLTADRAGAWTVTDLGSTNGTRVDGGRIDGPTRLSPGAELALGADGPRLRLLEPRTAGTGERTTAVVARY
ncbi:FHA domain-containing protein [Actinomycetospora atypica]|uniref:FHA domain-containing protein n=1 Tax=Actinomycetospora atypica TaxID=1290095 RepID=A0ABV9YT40_9PSEU